MYLSQLVTINEKAIVANAVNFGLMDDPAKNLLLCEGFVFNYDSNKPKASTVGVLDALRRSFHSPNEPNIHLMVQDYGKGKSHFALAVANFFQKPYNSPEVEGVLKQVEYATSSKNQILDALKHYKQQGRNLVICLSGDKSDKDLKRQFIQAVKKTLNDEGINDVIAQRICNEPLQYLENLTLEQRESAEAYLEEIGNPEGDINEILNNLRDNNYQVVNRVKQICRRINKFTPDFDADIDVEEILTDLVKKLCIGNDRRFNGILIIFDELYNYLQNWSTDPVAAGGTTLQNITNICEKYKGKITLLSLTQRRPGRVTPSKNVEDYNRLVSRVELLTSTYEPATSLESVLNNLLSQQTQTSAWQVFEKKWQNTLNDTSTKIFQNRTANYYQSRNWQAEKFKKEITIGCFPLYPLTSYLLCNLDFTQGRGAIQFVQETVHNFIQQQPVEVNGNGNINFIYPVHLVDALESNFSKSGENSEYSTVFSDYTYSSNKVKASADKELEEVLILKALLLFYTSNGKLVKGDKEKHEELLSILTGLTIKKTRETLHQLDKVRGIIYLNPADNTYRFYSNGFGIDEIKRQIKEKSINKSPSIEKVVNYCQSNIEKLVGSENTIPSLFIGKNGLRSEDWKYQNKVYTVTRFEQALQISKILDGVKASGIVAYVVAETQEQLLGIRNKVNQLLERSPIKGQIVVAIISQPIDKLAKKLMEYGIVESMRLQDYNAALTQVKQLYDKEINDITVELFKSCTYYCHILDKVPTADRNNISKMVSAVLEDRYPLVPTVNNNDKMYLGHRTGTRVIAYLSKCLLENDSLPQVFPDKSFKTVVDQVFTNSWGLFKVVHQQYLVNVPTHRNIKAAWDKISNLTALGEELEKTIKFSQIWETLSSPPYGYNQFTFTILLAGWLAYHRSELLISGAFGIPKGSEQVTVRKEAVKSWASIDVFEHPQNFVDVWVKNGRNSIIRRKPTPYPQVPNSVNYDEAQQFIQDIINYLATAQDADKIKQINTVQRILTAGAEQLDNLIEPITQAETLLQKDNVSTDIDIQYLLNISEVLQKPLSTVSIEKFSIHPTQQQQERHKKISQTVIEKIGQIIDSECARIESLNSQADCETYKTNITRLKNKISQVNYLPSRFAEQLQNALQVSNLRLSEIVEQTQVDNCINEVQNLYSTLKALATQADYHDIEIQIEQRVVAAPIAREKDTYKNIINELKAKQEALIQKISDWENQFTQNISLSSALQMSSSINQEIQRFTDEYSTSRLHKLLERLKGIILQRETESEESDVINDVLDTAARKLEEAKNAKKLSDAFKAYKELDQLKLPLQIKAVALKNKPAELETLKSQNYTEVLAKINQVFEKCDQPINQKSDYQQLQDSLREIKIFINTCDDFRKLSDDLCEAEDTLQTQYDEFQKHEEDKQSFSAIRQKSPKSSNTIRLCEEAIANIDTSRSNFNYPEQFVSEVDKIVKDFQAKITTYKHELDKIRENLSRAKTFQQVVDIKNSHTKLEFVFNGSSEYNVYQELQAVIDSVAEDIKHLNYWESLYKQSNSIASCDSTLESISQEKAALHNLGRFEAQLEQLQANLAQKKQGYINQLNELEAKLSSIINQKQAQTLQTELTNKSSYYQASQLEPRYQGICSELSTLNNLLQITAAQKVDTIDNCIQEKERLQHWCQNTGEITATVQNRYNAILAELEKTKQKLENQQRETARKWFDDIVGKKQRLEVKSESARLNDAISLLKQIKQQKHQYEQILQSEEQQTLNEISNYCLEIQNQDKESKIISLFQELPLDKRESLLQRLANISASTTEEF